MAEHRNRIQNGNIYIEDVINVKELQTLQDNWAKATDLAFVTVDVNGEPITSYSNFTPFCEKLRKTDAYREKCYYCDACGGRKARRVGRAYVYVCHAGLIDFSIPIMIKGQYVGSIQAGQVTSKDFEDLRPVMPLSEDWKVDDELRKLHGEVSVMSVEKIKAVAQTICDSYNYSVEKEYANKVEAELREKKYRVMKEEKLRIEMEKSLRDIELKALHYQINPHFMFNVLNTIGRLAFFENAKMTEDVIYSFSDMMRYLLQTSSDPLTMLSNEVTHVQNYLKIQKIRLGSRLQYSIDIQEKYLKVKVPFLSVTTIVENSVKYAVENKAEGGVISVTAAEKGKDLWIEIADDGDGIAPEKVVSILRGDAYKNKKDGSVGIYNVNTRLIHCFGNEYGLNITSPGRPGQGTRVTIRVPIISDADFS